MCFFDSGVNNNFSLHSIPQCLLSNIDSKNGSIKFTDLDQDEHTHEFFSHSALVNFHFRLFKKSLHFNLSSFNPNGGIPKRNENANNFGDYK